MSAVLNVQYITASVERICIEFLLKNFKLRQHKTKLVSSSILEVTTAWKIFSMK